MNLPVDVTSFFQIQFILARLEQLIDFRVAVSHVITTVVDRFRGPQVFTRVGISAGSPAGELGVEFMFSCHLLQNRKFDRANFADDSNLIEVFREQFA